MELFSVSNYSNLDYGELMRSYWHDDATVRD
jgi:hypothetical protein